MSDRATMARPASHRSDAYSWYPGSWDPTIRRSLLMMSLVVGMGTAGYTWIEGWSPWQSLFFTLVTLTTVGYGDYGLSAAGERFTAILMIGGIAIVSYTASQILHFAISKATYPERRMIQQAKQMHGHFIVCGLGRTGQRVIRRLMEEDATLVAIDQDPKLVEDARERGIVAFEGDATSDQSLLDAGIDRAASLAAVTSSDAANAMICLTARALATDISIVARAEEEASVCKLKRAGADRVVSPASYGGDGIAANLLHPEVASLLHGLEDGHGDVEFVEYFVSPSSTACGKTILELGKAHPKLVFVASHAKGGATQIRPPATHVLREGEVLVLAGTQADLDALRQTSRIAA